jgi:hypothetical protein
MKPFRQRQQHRPKKNTLVIGISAVTDALKSGTPLERIFIQATAHGLAIEAVKFCGHAGPGSGK